jgi:murein DD-endopeptidase MepM/ murein hydrolase activator NlpD
LAKRTFARNIKPLSRALAAFRSRHFPRHGAWLLGLAIFLTALVIAAIMPRGVDALPSNGPVLPASSQAPSADETNQAAEPEVATRPAAAAESSTTPLSRRGQWIDIVVRKGDTLSDILEREGHDSGEINRVMAAHPEARVFRRLYPGQTLRLRAEPGQPWQELVYETAPGEALHLVRQDDRFELTKEIRRFDTRIAQVTGTIESSLFEDGQAAGLPDPLIMKLAEIFGWDIDFALDLRHGDSFSVIYEEKYWHGRKITDGSILAAEFVNQGRVFRAIGYRDANGVTAYYTPEGMSVRRPFLRTPVEFSRITSRFSSGRFHPILKKWRAHKGVDYGAPPGTPVRATADGRILSMGWNGGYGKRIVIRHNATYSTVYAHLSRYNAKLRVGGFVEQGQIIGYVGATGLATGPHLHYEFRVNGVHRNPLTYRFPGSTPIAREYRDDFTRAALAWSTRLDVISRGGRMVANRQPDNPL